MQMLKNRITSALRLLAVRILIKLILYIDVKIVLDKD